MTAVSNFLRFVLPHAPTAAEISVTRYLVDSAVEFCSKTGIWREDLPIIQTTALQPNVNLTPLANSQIIEITDVYFDGQHIEAAPPDTLKQQGDHWFDKTSSLPRAYFSTKPTVITFVPTPDVVANVRVSAKLAPTRNAEELPDILLDRYAEIIALGALSRLLLEPSQAYTNPQKAMMCADQFEARLAKVRKEAQEGFTRARFRVKPRYF